MKHPRVLRNLLWMQAVPVALSTTAWLSACSEDTGSNDGAVTTSSEPSATSTPPVMPVTGSGPVANPPPPTGNVPGNSPPGPGTVVQPPTATTPSNPVQPPGPSAEPNPTGEGGSGTDDGMAGAEGTLGGSGTGASGGSPTLPPTTGGGGNAGSENTGGAGNATASGGGGSQTSGGDIVAVPSELLWTGVRYYPGGTGVGNRSSGPEEPPTQIIELQNSGGSESAITLTLSGDAADRYTIVSPASFPAVVAPGASLEVELVPETNNDELDGAPAQDDGATVLSANLNIEANGNMQAVRLYGLVQTYVELEPTFGQILDAFPELTSNIPDTLRNDANPNPGTLPGVEGNSDEVAAAAFVRATAGEPVVLEPIARFSPPGSVPFGHYTPGNPDQRTEVGAMGEASDPHTNNKSRMLLPPLASGGTTFDPGDGAFSLWMAPADVGLLFTEDDANEDGQHRVKVFTLRDSEGTVIPNTFLVGGEEAANGDYQDYVFILRNARPE